MNFVHRALGYSLSADTSEQCLFLCVGSGANGKSTLLDTFRGILGDYGHVTPFSTLQYLNTKSSVPNDVAALVNRRLVIASETDIGSRFNEARIKTLTGSDTVSARFLYSEAFTFRPSCKLWLAANDLPDVSDDSHGFWRRIRVIPFNRTFAVNPNLEVELLAEREGILDWAVRGALEWQRRGLEPPAAVQEATDQYRTESDPLAGFVAACDVGDDKTISASELYRHYTVWCARERVANHDRLSKTMFGRRMTARFAKRKTRAGSFYSGIAGIPLIFVAELPIATGPLPQQQESPGK